MRSNRLPFYIVLLLVAAAILFSAAAAQAQSCPELPSEGSWAVTSGETPSVHSDPCSGVHVGNNTLQTIIDFGRQLLFHGVYLNDLDHGMWSIVIRNGTEEALLLENLHTGNNERVYNAFATPVPGTSFEVNNPQRDSHGVNLWVIEPTPSEAPTDVATETPVPPTEVPTETVTPTETVETPEPTLTQETPTPTVIVPIIETTPEVVHDVECITYLAAPIVELHTIEVRVIPGDMWYEVRNNGTSQTKIVLRDGHLSNSILLAWLADGSVVAIQFQSGWADVEHGTGQNNCYRLEPRRHSTPAPTASPFVTSPLPDGWDPVMILGNVDPSAVTFEEGINVASFGHEFSQSGLLFEVQEGCLFFWGGDGNVEFIFNGETYIIETVSEWEAAQPTRCLYDPRNSTVRAVAGSTVDGFAFSIGILAGDLEAARQMWLDEYGTFSIIESNIYAVPPGWLELAQ